MEEKAWHQLVDNYLKEFCGNRAKGKCSNTEGQNRFEEKSDDTKGAGNCLRGVPEYMSGHRATYTMVSRP